MNVSKQGRDSIKQNPYVMEGGGLLSLLCFHDFTSAILVVPLVCMKFLSIILNMHV